MCIEKTCKTCINLCNKRGEVCNLYKGEVQEMIKEIDRKLTVEEAVRIIKEEGYMDFERTKIGGNMIEVGEYVRTKEGEIHKVIKIIEDDRDWDYYCCENNAGYFAMDVAKHSKQLIDLIEEGDYVNGYYCRYITDINTGAKYLCNYDLNEMRWIPLENIDIWDNILTKEQYEANCYKVKEE